MNFTLRVWRQESTDEQGGFRTYEVTDIASDESFLEMIDELNDRLIVDGERPVYATYEITYAPGPAPAPTTEAKGDDHA